MNTLLSATVSLGLIVLASSEDPFGPAPGTRTAVARRQEQRAPQEPARQRRKIALLIQQVFLPEIGDEEKPNSEVRSRLDDATEHEPGPGVPAARTGAEIAGRAGGYDFTPLTVVAKGQTARAAVGKLPGRPEYVLLVRVSTRTPDFGSGPMVWLMADAALFRTEGLEPLLNAGFMSIKMLDRDDKIRGDKIDGQYWTSTVATAFARDFDEKVLAQMQKALDGQTIQNAIRRLGRASSTTAPEPAVTPLEGGDKRPPELRIVSAKPHSHGVVYLSSKAADCQRKWLFGDAGDLDVNITPGQYTVYAETWSGGNPSARRVYRGEARFEYKARYSYTFR